MTVFTTSYDTEKYNPNSVNNGYFSNDSSVQTGGVRLIPINTGRSENPKDSTLFDLSRSVEEVEWVRKVLNLTADNVYNVRSFNL